MGRSADAVLADAMSARTVPNVVAIAADRDVIIYRGAAGTMAPDDDRPVGGDTVYRIMSMTKMLVTVAALQLRDHGRLDFDAPIDEYFPAFAANQVLDGFDGDTPRYRDPASRATVRQAVTHTTGLGYWFWNPDLVRWQQATNTRGVLSGTGDFLRAPMTFDPGTGFQYGISTDVLGQCVAAAAGKGLDTVLDEGILGPLGMTDTTYHASHDLRQRLTPVQAKDANGTWVATGTDYAQDPQVIPGGHGLYSTADDYARFQRALLRGGELDGIRILSEATVAECFTNQVGEFAFPPTIQTADPRMSADFRAGPGHTWGWGLLVNTTDQAGRRRAGSGAWAGLCNTHFWIDPTSGITGAIYSQTLPFVAPDVAQLYADFERAVYESLA